MLSSSRPGRGARPARPVLRTAAPLALATLLTVLGPPTAAPAPAAAVRPVDGTTYTRTDTLFREQGNGGYDVRHYEVSLEHQPLTGAVTARTVLSARTTTGRAALRSLSLDLRGMTVDTVVVNHRRATWKRRGAELLVRPVKPVRGRFTVEVAYHGTPQSVTDADGSTEGWVRTPDGAIALGEPVGASTWLPSDNTPGDKATFTFHLTVPTPYAAVANGELVGSTTDALLRTTSTWRMRRPMATYLAMVATGLWTTDAGSYTSIDGRTIPLLSYTDPGATSTEGRTVLPEVLRFSERYFGPYPFDSAGLVVDNALVGYALETQGRPFFPLNADTGTVVHEVAHQWFGNSLTLRDWHDIWLAEGFATYAEWLWDGAHGGQTPAQHFDALYARPSSDGLWTPAPTRFTDPADLFGDHVYLRGAMTLQALRERIGDPTFFRLLKRWAAENRHGTVRSRGFENLASYLSRQDLSRFFDTWLRKAGKPRGY